MNRPEQEPDPDPAEFPPTHGERREFLVQLGKMTFLTAAVVKLGVAPGAQVEIGPGEKRELEIDLSCGKPLKGPTEGAVSYDNDCGKEKSNGDQDCGKTAPSGHHWDDADCVVSGGDGADNDCGKSSSGGWTWDDNDCSQGGEDQDCGKSAPGGGNHSDSDGS